MAVHHLRASYRAGGGEAYGCEEVRAQVPLHIERCPPRPEREQDILDYLFGRIRVREARRDRMEQRVIGAEDQLEGRMVAVPHARQEGAIVDRRLWLRRIGLRARA
jgi:hypothetical protein